MDYGHDMNSSCGNKKGMIKQKWVERQMWEEMGSK